MALSRNTLKWMMNLYPPLLFNRIFITRISKDFMELDVKIKHSLMNRNLNGSVFGGTMFSAADPFYALMYQQIFDLRKQKTEVWVRATEANYIKPGTTDLTLKFTLSEDDIHEARQALEKEGKFKKWHQVNIINALGDVCVEIKILVFIRKAVREEKSVF